MSTQEVIAWQRIACAEAASVQQLAQALAAAQTETDRRRIAGLIAWHKRQVQLALTRAQQAEEHAA